MKAHGMLYVPCDSENYRVTFNEQIKVDESTGCLLWQGKQNAESGYFYMEHGLEVIQWAWLQAGNATLQSYEQLFPYLCGDFACVNTEHWDVMRSDEWRTLLGKERSDTLENDD